MNMYTRNSVTYEYDPAVVGYILQDDANPLRRICEMIPSGSKVLDVGAGNGLLAVVMKALNKNVIIDGIEPDPHAAGIAKSHYRHFQTGYVQDFKESIQVERYDFIVMADVLEHFQDPQAFLQQLVSWIPVETKIVLSIPNIAFGAVRLDLLKGNFRYVDSGILEKTHLRFFTIETLQKLVASSGLTVEKLMYLQRDFFTTGIPHDISEFSLATLYKLVNDETASVYQFVVILSQGASVTEERSYYGARTRISAVSALGAMIRKWLI